MKYSNTDFLSVFSNCILIKGASRCAIQDLDRNQFYPIPTELFELMDENSGFKIAETLKKFQGNEHYIESFIEFVLTENIAQIIDEKLINFFPKLNSDYRTPFQITNVILDVKDDIQFVEHFFLNHGLKIIPTIQFRFFSDAIIFDDLLRCLKFAEKQEVISYQIVVPASIFLDNHYYERLNELNKLEVVLVYGIAFRIQNLNINYRCAFLGKNITDAIHCGVINFEQFSNNIETFTESQHHNTCLNRKISIDSDGNIKNCPSMAKSYGNIKDAKLLDVVNNPDFQKVWHIKKDEISKCKDCEFRHICTDCRAYIENPEDQYSAPLKCGYNPYTCEWEEWSTNPLKQKAIEHYGMQELVKK